MRSRWMIGAFVAGVCVGMAASAVSQSPSAPAMRPPTIQLRSPATWTTAQREALQQLVNDINGANDILYRARKSDGGK